MNAIMKRWARTSRTELPDRTLIWNQRHLTHTLREHEDLDNARRPPQKMTNRPDEAGIHIRLSTWDLANTVPDLDKRPTLTALPQAPDS